MKNCDKCGQEILLPWENEPDELFFIDKETGYQCQILRRCKKTEYRMIYLCGYVKIPENHPFYNLEFVLCTSLRRYFLRRDLLLEKRKDNHVKSRLKNADI